MPDPEFRIERDSMGELRVPSDALWGAQTQRAVLNFAIAGRPMPSAFIGALASIKAAAAHATSSTVSGERQPLRPPGRPTSTQTSTRRLAPAPRGLPPSPPPERQDPVPGTQASSSGTRGLVF